jgi:hypothetical protein
MKKVLVLTAFVFAISSMCNAQFRFGIKAGANMSNFTTNTTEIVDQIKASSNYQFGILFQIPIVGNFVKIQPEILYSVKGSEMTDITDPDFITKYETSDIKIKTQNIEVPVNLQVGLSLGFARAYVQAGPYFSYLSGGDVGLDKTSFKEFADDFSFNKVDYGVGFGAGAELLGFQLALRYDLGFNPIGANIDEIVEGVDFNNLKNRNFNISLAYIF